MKNTERTSRGSSGRSRRRSGSSTTPRSNGDGVPDLAVANGMSNSVSVLLGNGDGSFQAARNFGAGRAPYSAVAGDFNGDGLLDLAIANSASDDVSVLLGNGDGSFQTARSFGAGSVPICAAV